ncbi:EGF domain-specific O-linked N-acetylglucosamine transferase-like protein [Leptotrombidium deliense]|uniref:EGF domain-specific O-linked N-acetylglucosamine transferase n=1 Tax=Leptotrombidium deliense TaxID=299467 RepID=A0A443SW64_9ACAR|nr:EGF domain-specific O-linked N-acetylglucosamine transferase-like protein [Leptotrombidium deliense]
MKIVLIFIFSFFACVSTYLHDLLSLVDLPADIYAIHLNSNHRLKEKLCAELTSTQLNLSDERRAQICETVEKSEKKCWGYEGSAVNCSNDEIYSLPECPEDSNGWAPNKVEQRRVFFNQADFGYIRERRKELRSFCTPRSKDASSLHCTQYLRFCKATNMLIDFNRLKINESMRYKEDVVEKGAFCGRNCDLNEHLLQSQSAHKSALQSWFNEISNYKNCDETIKCDIRITKPTFIVKLDATVNMYHHFCDFVNLYLSQHLNGSFSLDNNILLWDIYPYRSIFGQTWKAFTKNALLNLSQFRGKRVCFDDLVFPLLPRMIFGLYYNMPLIPGCLKSGVFRAFNRHVLHKLKIKQEFTPDNYAAGDNAKLVRITFITRDTQYRRVLNEEQLINALRRKSKQLRVRKVNYNHQMPFEEQLQITQNSDILIGMHGAGLTHCLFQPDWASLFELYNCDDANCYKDLARLRGLQYITWSDKRKLYPEDQGQHPQMGAHEKFTNYKFDESEFVKLTMIAVRHVRQQRKQYFERLIKSVKSSETTKQKSESGKEEL